MRRSTPILCTMVVTLVLGAGVALAGGGGHGTAACRGFDEGQTLLMRENCFEGVGHVVTAGETVTVTNVGRAPHSVTAADGSFDSGHIAPGDSYELTLDETGTVPIYCTLHGSRDGDGMAGLLVVQAADLTDAAPAASPLPASPWGWLATALVIGLAAVGLVRRRLRGPAVSGAGG